MATADDVDPTLDASFALAVDQASASLRQRLLEEFRAAKSELELRRAAAVSALQAVHVEQLDIVHVQLLDTQKCLADCEKKCASKAELDRRFVDTLLAKKGRAQTATAYLTWSCLFKLRQEQNVLSAVCQRHYINKLCRRTLLAWRGVVEHGWRIGFEKKIKAEAEIQMTELAQEYEVKLGQLTSQLVDSQQQLRSLKSLHDQHEEEMKTAFMRGVSAINKEAMSFFKQGSVAMLEDQLSQPNRRVAFAESFLPLNAPSALPVCTSHIDNDIMPSKLGSNYPYMQSFKIQQQQEISQTGPEPESFYPIPQPASTSQRSLHRPSQTTSVNLSSKLTNVLSQPSNNGIVMRHSSATSQHNNIVPIGQGLSGLKRSNSPVKPNVSLPTSPRRDMDMDTRRPVDNKHRPKFHLP